ncbi:MAG: hypothetical protein Q6356_003245 [Candidatus Wukongarchaeota archaeon]|nr:hypothetical protein [Candidatus Wukongarchaeota archaeon]
MYPEPKSKDDPATIKKIADFLFGRDKNEKDSQFLDRRTDVAGKNMFSALMYYRILQEKFSCKVAGDIANVIERLSISMGRKGREEGVVTLMRRDFPTVQNIRMGLSELLKSESSRE